MRKLYKMLENKMMNFKKGDFIKLLISRILKIYKNNIKN